MIYYIAGAVAPVKQMAEQQLPPSKIRQIAAGELAIAAALTASR